MSDELWRMADRMGCHNHQERRRERQKARPEKNTKKRSTVKRAVTREPTYEEITQRAYELYLARGAAPGQNVDDWLQAECELRGAPDRGSQYAKADSGDV